MNYETPISVQGGRALRQYPWMDGNVKADVCIVGGGVTGALCALRLVGEGRSVVLLSGRPIGYGATSRLMPCSMCDCGQELRTLSRRTGRDTAARLLDLTRDAADELEELCAALNGGIGFARRDCVVYAGSDADAERLRREYAEYRRAGFDCVGMDRSAFGSAFAFPAPAALLISGGAVELDAFMLAQHAAAAAEDAGAIIFENTRAQRISAEKNGRVTVHTSTHRRVDAGCVVVAAGFSSAELLDGILRGRTRYVAAGRPMRSFRGWHGRCVLRSLGEPGLICCTSPDDRMYISCEASAVDHGRERLRGALHLPSVNEKRYTELEDAARYLFPESGMQSCESGWTLRSLTTADGLPVAGSAPGQPGCLFAVSGGEGGVLLSVMLSRMVSDVICGKGSEDMMLFSPARRRLAG